MANNIDTSPTDALTPSSDLDPPGDQKLKAEMICESSAMTQHTNGKLEEEATHKDDDMTGAHHDAQQSEADKPPPLAPESTPDMPPMPPATANKLASQQEGHLDPEKSEAKQEAPEITVSAPPTTNDDSGKSETSTKPETIAEPTALEKYWTAVRDNPSDFTGWTYLLQYVEQDGTVKEGREAFDAFLAKYPYCYGYWKKYADLEQKHNELDAVEEVYERGLKAIPLSIELWSHYITFMYEKTPKRDSVQTEKIRAFYERAISAAGTDFRSDKLWESYINWETENKNTTRVTLLYDRLLRIPTYLYSHHFEKFVAHVKSHAPKDLVSLDEFLKLRMEHVKKRSQQAAEEEDGGPPGDEAPPGSEEEEKDVKEIEELREAIIETRRDTHKRNEEEVSRRWSYEEGIRRPYFHVKPLERVQLKNWRDYLDFEIENGPHERVVVLFERCMIACALYEEFWLKYARYLEPFSPDGVHHVFERACAIHLPRKPLLHMHWAAYEERQGNVKLAQQILQQLTERVPGLAMVDLRAISLHRRQGNFTTVENLYKKHLESTNKEVRSFYAIKYARYLTKTLGNPDRAEKILRDAVEDDPTNPRLYMQLIDTEYQRPMLREVPMLDVFSLALQSEMDLDTRMTFSQRRLEFLEDFGSTINRIMEAYEEHQKLAKEVQNKKRKATDKEDSGVSKKAKTEPSASSSQAPPPQHHQQQSYQGHQGHSEHMDNNQYNHAAWQQWMGAYQNYGYGQQGGWGGGYNQNQQGYYPPYRT